MGMEGWLCPAAPMGDSVGPQVPAGRSLAAVGPLFPSGTPRCPRDTEHPAWEGSRVLGMATAPG